MTAQKNQMFLRFKKMIHYFNFVIINTELIKNQKKGSVQKHE